jgi:hypothetical protein
MIFLDEVTVDTTFEGNSFFLIFALTKGEVFFPIVLDLMDDSFICKLLHDTIEGGLVHFMGIYEGFFEASKGSCFLLFEKGENMSTVYGREHTKKCIYFAFFCKCKNNQCSRIDYFSKNGYHISMDSQRNIDDREKHNEAQILRERFYLFAKEYEVFPLQWEKSRYYE